MMTKQAFDKIAAGLREAQDVAAIIAERDAAIRERDEARAALASARDEALEEAAEWHDTESVLNHREAFVRGTGDGDYWRLAGRANQHKYYAAKIRAMKREPG